MEKPLATENTKLRRYFQHQDIAFTSVPAANRNDRLWGGDLISPKGFAGPKYGRKPKRVLRRSPVGTGYLADIGRGVERTKTQTRQVWVTAAIEFGPLTPPLIRPIIRSRFSGGRHNKRPAKMGNECEFVGRSQLTPQLKFIWKQCWAPIPNRLIPGFRCLD